jgi:hypothetical protein
MERKIIFANEVDLFFDELLIILFEKGYFGSQKTAKVYKDKFTDHIKKYIGVIQGKDAPEYFCRYGNDLKYITYKANKTTTWYIFYQQKGNVFLIRYITNNHVAAQYFAN